MLERSMMRRGALAAAAAVAVIALSACATQGPERNTVTVEHGPAPAPDYVDLGAAGESVGDQRIFHFDGQSAGTTVTMDWIMTTTAIDAPKAGVETRVTTAVFNFDGLDDTILLGGSGWYPGANATFEVSATLVRAITGGTGAYRGATGWVVTTHHEDNTWTHVFHID